MDLCIFTIVEIIITKQLADMRSLLTCQGHSENWFWDPHIPLLNGILCSCVWFLLSGTPIIMKTSNRPYLDCFFLHIWFGSLNTTLGGLILFHKACSRPKPFLTFLMISWNSHLRYANQYQHQCLNVWNCDNMTILKCERVKNRPCYNACSLRMSSTSC